MCMLSVCLVKIIFANLFYYSAYFLYYLWVPLYYFSQLLPLCTILLAKSFLFQQNKHVLNRSLVIKTKFQQYVNWINVTGVIFTTKKQILNYFFVMGDASICNIYVVKFIVSLFWKEKKNVSSISNTTLWLLQPWIMSIR